MIAFEVHKNGKRVVVAGVPGYAVLSAIVGWVNRRPRPGLVAPKTELNLSVSGMNSNGEEWEQSTHVRWAVPEVKVGDTIRIRIVESEKVDEPNTEYPTMGKAELNVERKRSAKHYLALYRQQRKALDRQIAHLEHEQKRLRGAKSKR